MPKYEEIIEQSQANVKSLGEKLKDLDKLHNDIVILKNSGEAIPKAFEEKFHQVIKVSEDYTNTLGASTKKYLDGNNTLFTANLGELSDQSKNIKTKLDEFKKEVERLASIDFTKDFDKLQKTLAEIYGAINSINLTLTTLTQTQTGLVQTLGAMQNAIDFNQKEAKQTSHAATESTLRHLKDQDAHAEKNSEMLKSQIVTLSEQNQLLKKDLNLMKTIQLIGLSVILIIALYIAVK